MKTFRDKIQNFGVRLKAVRLKRGIPQAELGWKCHRRIALTTISAYERGVSYPTLEKLADIIDVLGCEYSDLLD